MLRNVLQGRRALQQHLKKIYLNNFHCILKSDLAKEQGQILAKKIQKIQNLYNKPQNSLPSYKRGMTGTHL